MAKKKQFTWADLKSAVNKMPEQHLSKVVTVWGDERGFVINGIEVLKEDYLHDGDEGCAPKSELKNGVTKEEWKSAQEFDTHYLIHEKGTRILLIDLD